ncbi:hypothetical protein WV31_06540 [Magnetospirillum sp. ME-1]|uniref:hypothetical protein n=1 Tax=Magnetospirillum sp. ME-1 TaxID=1639348 RepID=UPI000A17C82C|nr:hypothetical protein [Magnetospirillum sp. ME-1]ARJ65333.1 hypothetical protein WV31_06540 [Magnetospirillum sp. ME-1]
MADEALKRRLEDAAATGKWATFTSDDVIPAAWIRDFALAENGHPRGLRIKGATIQGRLDFEDCTLPRPLWLSACAIADGIVLLRAKAVVLGFYDCPLIGGIEGGDFKVDNSLFLRGSTIKGRVFLIGAKIGGDLDCVGVTLDGGRGGAFEGEHLEIKDGMFLRDGFSAKGVVNLSHARIGVLVDEAACWPDLILSGMTYDSIGPESPQTAEDRLRWLGRRKNTDKFDPQPYEHLAKVLKATGHDGEARKILVAKENERLRKGEMGWLHRLLWAMYGAISGYGYRRFRPLIWMAVIIALGGGVFHWAKGEGVMVPAKERVYIWMADKKVHQPPSQYPRLNPLIYSADLFLPFVDLAQDSYWMPSSVGKWGRWVTFYMWGHIAMGWIVSALFVAGVTGLVKRE